LKDSIELNNTDNSRQILLLGGITGFLACGAILFDIIYGSITHTNLAELPKTAVEFFNLFNKNIFMGLYNLDIINAGIYFVSLPFYFSLAVLHKKNNFYMAIFAVALYFTGTAVFLANNCSLPMVELSGKFFSASSDQEINIIAIAGESLLAKGSHGSPGTFLSMFILSISGIIMSLIILKAGIINKKIALAGVIGNPILLIYILMVTFRPETKSIAMLIAAPGGLLNLVWMTSLSIKLLRVQN
jgi:hypothetical protein